MPGPVPVEVQQAVAGGGGVACRPEDCEALVWLGDSVAQLEQCLDAMRRLRWVQLPWAGTEWFHHLMKPSVTWTSGSGVLAEPVAEHALMLSMAAMRCAGVSVRQRRWTPTVPGSLFDARVVVVGAGAVARALVALLVPFRAHVTVVRRCPESIPGVSVVTSDAGRRQALAVADVVILAAPLTAETHHLIERHALRMMQPNACLVNVARGGMVDTEALVEALEAGWIGGAALDTTDPEPLPPAHPLWDMDNCFITAHSAGDLGRSWHRYGELIADNMCRFASGRPLRNVVSVERGY
ncbi:NAD(P)-dependent oxidoreductase [Dactylosporangium sp. NPDC049525]|uniref:NAD(P)-dependent oxidoreductase n=1 Tax=Dactylosporangium sp. NPDC049525 TaxID=3154730 RepID=UPI0034275F86